MKVEVKGSNSNLNIKRIRKIKQKIMMLSLGKISTRLSLTITHMVLSLISLTVTPSPFALSRALPPSASIIDWVSVTASKKIVGTHLPKTVQKQMFH